MRLNFLLLTFFMLAIAQFTFAQKNCCTSLNLVPTTYGSGPTDPTYNTPDDVSCSCLNNELGSVWFSFSATTYGSFEMMVVPAFQPVNYDFAIWEGTCPCSGGPTAPVFSLSCNSDVSTAETGIAKDPFASFGVPASPAWSPEITLQAGKNYFLLINNAVNNGYPFDIYLGGSATIAPQILDDFGLTINGPTTVCTGSEIVFSATDDANINPSYFTWIAYENGQQIYLPSFHEPTLPINFTTDGTYKICVQVTNPDLGCFPSQQICKTVVASTIPFPASYESGIVCTGSEYIAGNGEVFYYGGTFDLEYQSYQGCDSIVRLNLQQKISDFKITVKEVCEGECVTWGGVTYCDPGTYDDVQQNQFGCDSINQLFMVVIPLETKINGATVLDCNHPSIILNSTGSIYNANASFVWKKGGNVVGNGPTLTVTTEGTYTLEITSPVGDHTCTVSASITITKNTTVPQGVTAVGGNTNCISQQVTLMGNSTTPNVTYFWTGPNGFTSNLQNPTVSPQGNYLLTVTGANGCTKTATAVVSENKVLPTAVAVADGTIHCNATTVQLNGAGSSTGNQFTYHWTTTNGTIDLGENTLTPIVSQGGTYVLTVTNTTNGCTNSATATVVQLQPVTSQITGTTNVTCFNGNNGASTIQASGGTGNYTYAWSNNATTATVSNLSAGNYSVVVTDGNGCSSTQSITISQPANLLPNATTTSQTTSGVDDGTATANPSGGTSGYTYLWNNGQTTQTITGLAPANYTVVVTDANGCTASQTVTVSEVACNVSTDIDQTNVSCSGAANGTATVTLINGNGTVTYAWSNGETTQTVTGLSGGTYNVSVSDENGCEIVETIVVLEPLPLMANLSHTNLTAYQSNDGTATATPSGGNTPYSYLWSNGETTANITGLAPGTYTLVITDALGCTTEQDVTVTPFNCTVAGSILLNEISCNGAADGQATFSLIGGDAPYTYEWSNGGTNASITGLPAGTYIGTATDGSGCQVIAEATLTDPPAIGVEVTNLIAAQCGTDNGSITVTGTGGIPGYTYLWQTGGETTPTISGLIAGTYTVSITDANGCSDSFEVTLGTDDNVFPVVTTQNITIQLNANGQATILPGDIDNGSTDDCQIVNYSLDQTTFGCADLGANTVTLSVTDIGSNTATGTAIVTVEETIPPIINCPADILVAGCNAVANFNVTATDNCGGNVAITQTAGLPSGSNFPLGNTTVSFNSTDISGNTASCSFVITVQSDISLTISQNNVSCFNENDGSATANPSGALPPVTYIWSNGDDSQTITGLVAGPYSVVITDAGGCTASQTITITQPNNLATSLVNLVNAVNDLANGSIDVSVAGGTLPYTYVWKNSLGVIIGDTEDIDGLLPGTYSLLVTDGHGCQSQSGYTIQKDVATTESALNSHVLLYPNPTLGEVTLELVDLTNYVSVEVTAFDITGRQILHSTNPGSKQLLDFKTKPSGVYVLKIRIDGDVITRRLVVSK